MDRRELHKRLEQLDGELGQIAAADERERAILDQARADLRDLLARSDDPDTEQVARLSAGLRERIAELEASYPRATIVFGQIVDTLALLGL